jgi:RnfABCDGE-type electron transport complex B subunit
MITYIIPIIVFVALGAACGVILVLAGRLFFVPTDETLEQVTAQLPGMNCGACGFSGCEGYAKAVIAGNVAPTQCKPGGQATADGVAEVLGLPTKNVVREVAQVRCANCTQNTAYEWGGVASCYSAARVNNGGCAFGCAGYGDCAGACEYGAIRVVNGVASVDPSVCVSCGKCVIACPRRLIEFRKVTARTQVLCMSNDAAKKTRESCPVGCITCKICVKKCPNGAVTIPDKTQHAVIDPEKCTNCGICAAACPRKTIHQCEECV